MTWLEIRLLFAGALIANVLWSCFYLFCERRNHICCQFWLHSRFFRFIFFMLADSFLKLSFQFFYSLLNSIHTPIRVIFWLIPLLVHLLAIPLLGQAYFGNIRGILLRQWVLIDFPLHFFKRVFDFPGWRWFRRWLIRVRRTYLMGRVLYLFGPWLT